MKLSVLSSGSSGNMVYVEAEDKGILIDAGISTREAKRRMQPLGLDTQRVHAVLLTHEHADHCKGASVLCRSLNVPLYMSNGTATEYNNLYLTNGRGPEIRTFNTGETLTIGPFLIEPFPTPHDARDSCGYVIWHRDIKAAVVTDLGHLPMLIRQKIHGSRMLVLESNHDERMLWEGRYPWWLKQRILSRHGHLSNAAVMEYLTAHLDGWCEYLFLAHISKENNTPEKALTSALEALNARGNRDTRIVLTSQDSPTPLLEPS